MKIYHLVKKDGATRGDMSACVVLANSAGEARALARDHATEEIWLAAAQTTCRQIGFGRSVKPHVVCADIWEDC